MTRIRLRLILEPTFDPLQSRIASQRLAENQSHSQKTIANLAFNCIESNWILFHLSWLRFENQLNFIHTYPLIMINLVIKTVLLVWLIQVSKCEYKPIELTSDQFQLDCLLVHNELREKHCSTPLKYSSKVCPIIGSNVFYDCNSFCYSLQLKTLATRRATVLAQTDGRYMPRLMDSTFGENIYRHRYNRKTNRTNCKTIVHNWYRERSRYDPDNGIATQTRRFAQVVWNATKHIGCGTVASSNPGGHVYTICNYYNLVRFPQNVSQNVMTIDQCDQKLSHRVFKTKRLTDAHWLQECIHEHNNIRRIHSVEALTITDEVSDHLS